MVAAYDVNSIVQSRGALVIERHGVGPLVPRPDLQFLLYESHVEPLLPREENRRQRAPRAAADDGDAGALAARRAAPVTGDTSRQREGSEEQGGAAHHNKHRGDPASAVLAQVSGKQRSTIVARILWLANASSDSNLARTSGVYESIYVCGRARASGL